MNRTCANCEELITGEPYAADGESFCCVGCAGGGPCQCTYTWAAAKPETAETTSVELLRSHDPHPADAQPLAWPAPERTTPTVRRRPSILRIAGLTNQLDLLRFGSALEDQPEIEDLSLVRSDLDDVWFAVTVRHPDALADALVHIDGFEVDARPHPAGVDATVTVRASEEQAVAAFDAPAAVEALSNEPRPRFRLFRRPDEPAPYEERSRLPEPPAQTFEPPVRVSEPVFADAFQPAAPREPERVSAAVPNAETAPVAMLTAQDRPGGAVLMREHITVVAYPFRSFVALNEFQDALRALHGVVNVKVRRFYRGTLHLGVEYEDVIPLTERMRDLEGFAWRLVSSSPQEIEVMLEEQGDLVSSG